MDLIFCILFYSDFYDLETIIDKNWESFLPVLNDKKIDKDFLKSQDLMVVSLESWKKLVETRSTWLSSTPSTLIIQDGK